MSDAAGPVDPEQLLAETNWLRALAAHLVRDPGAADDVAQDTAVAALRSPPTGERRPWLARVARNFARQRHRAESRRARRDRTPRPRADEPSPAEIVERVDTHRLLAELVTALSEPNRTAIVLRYYEGLEPSEIAARLGVPPGTVRARVHRGLAELRERLEERHGGDRDAWLAALAPLADGVRPRSAPKWIVPAAAAGAAVAAVLWFATTTGGTGTSTAAAAAGSPAATRRASRSGDAASAAAASAPSATHVRGRAVGPDGRPAAGARVDVTDARPAGASAEPQAARLLADVETLASAPGRVVAVAADGTFDVGVPQRSPVRLVAAAAGLSSPPAAFDGSKDVADVELRMEAFVRLRGRVTDETAAPIAGARVAFVEFPAAWIGPGPVVVSAAATDERGRFEVGAPARMPAPGDDGRRVFVVAHEGFAPVCVPAGTPDDDVGIVLSRGALVAGTVLAADGRPAENVLVVVETRDPDPGFGPSAIPLSARTGPDGTFRVGPVGQSARFAFTIRATDAEGRTFVERNHEFPTGGPLLVRMPGMRTVRGRAVAAAGGSVVAGARIAVRVRQWGIDAPWPNVRQAPPPIATADVVAGPDGAFAFPVPDGCRALASFDAPDAAWCVASSQRAVEFDPARPAPAEPVEVRLDRRFAVEGDVVDADGRPVAGASVSLSATKYHADEALATTGADGRFRIAGAATWFQERFVVAQAPGRVDGFAGPIAGGDSRDVSGVRVVAGAACVSIHGRVEDERGRPVGGARVTLMNGAPYRTTTAGADGAWSFDDVRPGGAGLWANRPGFPSLAYREIETGPDGGDVGALRLDTETTVRGVVADETGTPVGGAQLVFGPQGEGGEGITRFTTTGADGAFEFGGIAPVRHVLRCETAPFPFVADELAVEPPAAEPLRLVIRRSRTIAGRLLDENGRPMSGVVVTAVNSGDPDPSGRRAHATTDGDGAFVVSGIGDGAFELHLAGERAVHEPVPVGTTGLVWSLAAARPIAGVVTDASGRGVAATRVEVIRAGVGTRRGPSAYGVAAVTTDADGRFDVTGFRDGTFTLLVRHPTLACEPVGGVRPGDAAVELRLTAGRQIAGVVVDADGNAVAGARIGASPVEGGGSARSAQSGDDGRFAVGGLVAGDYALHAVVVREGPPRVVLVGAVPAAAAGATDVRIVVAPRK